MVSVPKREEYQGARQLLPELHHVGWFLVPSALPSSLGPHRHTGWEICWIRRGSVDWWAENDAWEVPQGSIYITRPGEQHGATHRVQEPCELYWAMLDPPPAVVEELEQAPRVFPGSEAVTTAFRELLDEHQQTAALRDLGARAALHRLLALVVRAAHGSLRDARISPPVAKALAHAQQHLEEPVPVADLARASGLSPSRLHARFLAEVGETPATWLRRARLRRAKRLLTSGDRSITDIALTLGFPTSQYFATVFRRYTGMTPAAWRATASSGPT